MKFNTLLLQCPTHGIQNKMLLNRFYRGLGLENRGVVDQLSSGGITQEPYAIIAQLINHMTKNIKDTKKDHKFATLLPQLDILVKNIIEF